MYLLDTNVISEIRKVPSGRVDPVFADWARQADVQNFYLSVITIQELEVGFLLLARRDKQQALLLGAWFYLVLETFAGRILSLDLDTARRSAYLQVPVTRTVQDTYIAATAYVHNLTMITRNTKDFRNTGIPVINPWDYRA